jgi:2TM domain-containing protein
MPERSFSEEEVREILRRAVDREAGRGEGLDRERLIAAAQEIGIDAAHVDAAISEVERDRTVETELAGMRLERRHEAVSSIGTWGIVNSGLLALDWANGGGWFFYWPLTIWGMILLLRYKSLLFKNDFKDKKEAAARLEKRQAELERQLVKQRRKAKGQRLEDVIERGVDALVDAASRHLDGGRRSGRPPEPPPPPPPWSARTRVDETDEEADQDEKVEPGARRRWERR